VIDDEVLASKDAGGNDLTVHVETDQVGCAKQK
jgi:hypothetical protein